MRNALFALLLATAVFAADSRPKVRAVTAFVNIDARNYPAQIADTMRFLNAARDAYKRAGFDVETIRIVTQPFPRYTAGMKREDAAALFHKLNDLAATQGFSLNIGPSMLHDNDDAAPNALLVDALSTGKMNASLIVAAEDGIHWRAVREAAKVIHQLAQRSAHGEGNFNFAATAMVKPYGPFYPGAYHLEAGRAFAVGLEGAGMVIDAFSQTHDPVEAGKRLSANFARYLPEAEKAAAAIASSTGWTYEGIDPTPAPLGDVSIGRAIEAFTGAPFGSSGTMTAARIITQAVQSAPVKRIGYSGLMVPVLEDNVLARRWAEGTYNIDSLLAYSAVCAGGLDTVPLPGDTTEDRLARIIGDVASLAQKWNKPLAARLLPVPGKKSGDRTQFTDPRMANTVIH